MAEKIIPKGAKKTRETAITRGSQASNIRSAAGSGETAEQKAARVKMEDAAATANTEKTRAEKIKEHKDEAERIYNENRRIKAEEEKKKGKKLSQAEIMMRQH